MIFNEDEIFNGNLEHLKDDIREISLPKLAELLEQVNLEDEEANPEVVTAGGILKIPDSIPDEGERVGKPARKHLSVAEHTLRYLAGTRIMGILYQHQGSSPNHSIPLLGYSDSAFDVRSCSDTN